MREIYISEVKAKAKQSLSGRLGVAIIALLIYNAISSAANIIDNVMKSVYQATHLTSEINNVSMDISDTTSFVDYFNAANGGYTTPLWLSALSLIMSLLALPMAVGLAKLFIGLTRGEDMQLSVIFEPYRNAVKIVLVNAYTGIIVFLWTLLFIIPGIMAAYSYALINYIMAEDEDISVTDAARMSKELMYGHRFKLFTMQLSFIGWALLSVCTCGILWIAYVGPYYNAAMAEFYNEVSGKDINKYDNQVKDDADNTWGDGGSLY